jgi:hypothetical protein
VFIRYVFLVYDSTPEFEKVKTKDLPSNRKKFSLKKFAKKVKFEAPIAGTFFWVSTNPEEVGTTSAAVSESTEGVQEEEREQVFAPNQVVID